MSASTSISGRCSPPPTKRRGRRSRTPCIFWGCRRWRDPHYPRGGKCARRGSPPPANSKGTPLRLAGFTFARRTGFVGAVACLVSLTATLAAEPKPDASIKTKNVEASVFLDDKIKADPALSADGLAEGRKWLDKQAADAAASRKQD